MNYKLKMSRRDYARKLFKPEQEFGLKRSDFSSSAYAKLKTYFRPKTRQVFTKFRLNE
jgi:hypothetical protein